MPTLLKLTLWYLPALLLWCSAGHATVIDTDPRSKANRLKNTADELMEAAKYEDAAGTLAYLTDSMGVKEPEIFLNLALCHYKMGNSEPAKSNYLKATAGSPTVRSVAYLQLGIIAAAEENKEEALEYFKNSLRANPDNHKARHNYELLKLATDAKAPEQARQNEKKRKEDEKKKEEKKKEDEKKKNQENKDGDNKKEENKEGDQKDGENKDEKGDSEKDKKENGENGKEDQEKEGKDSKDNKDGKQGDKNKDGKEDKETPKPGDKKEEKPNDKGKESKPGENGKEQLNDASKDGDGKGEKPLPTLKEADPEKLRQMNLNEQKAKMLLEAIRENEVQYLQQLNKESNKKPDKNLPKW